MKRRHYLAAAGGASLTALTGCLSSVPLVGGTSCPPGEDEIGSINEGGSLGDQVTVSGKMDHTLIVDARGIIAFRIDGRSGTIPIYLESKPMDNEIQFGECLTVRGVVSDGSDREAEGPVIENASLVR